MAATESNAPSPRGALSRMRRNKGTANTSTNSLGTGSADGDDPESGGGLRASMDAAIEKVKDRTKRRSVDDRRGSDDPSIKRLAGFLPRKKREEKKDASGREPSLSAQSAGDSVLLSGNRSETSLLDDSGHSSLLTDDNSDNEGATDDPVANIPQIVEPSNTDSPPAAVIPSRSATPAEKLKGAFTLPRKQVAGGDTDSVKSAGSGGGGLGGLFRPKSRTSSVSSQAPDEPATNVATPPESDVPLPEAAKSQPQPDQSEERPATPKQRRRNRINTESLPATPANLLDTPTTLVTPPTPTDPNADAGTFPKIPVNSAPGASPTSNRPLNAIESIRHRRAQSVNLPSKLSNAIPAPLTPTVEESKTPGGTLTQPGGPTGFFSSFFSATQKAADQLSNNINTAIGQQNKSKPGTSQPLEEPNEDVTSSRPETLEGEDRQRAVETLGKGELSLSHLGITESQDTSPMTSTADLPQQASSGQTGQTNKRAEEAAAARAVSVAYEKPVQNVVSQATGRPTSIASQDHLTMVGDQSPPRSGADAEGIKRSGSVRSRLSGRRRRHRASSATVGTVATGSTIAAAIQASNAALANPSINGTGHRLTGFAVASSKRNKDFHQLFRSVPEDDYLIEDYSAALQRDILLHGRLYVSEGHICFSSNILGWVTNLVISFDEVMSVEKKSTAVIFPNAIVIQTLQARNTFASFVARDSTYELLIGIWKISHPNLKSSLNGVTLDDAGTGDKTEVADPEGSDVDSGDGSDDEVYDEDDDDDDVGSFIDAGMAPSIAGSDMGDLPLSRKTSAAPMGTAPQTNGSATKGLEGADAVVTGAAVSSDFPGPQTHAPTECADASEHYDRPLTDTTISAPLGKIYSLMFGPASGAFMRKWLVEEQKSRELNLIDDKTGLDNDHKTTILDYIKPLNAPVGPRQTKCITTNTLTAFDLEKAVSIDCSTQTPDVPSGSVFTTKTRYCLMWGPDNTTRLVASCPIEKGANDGQIEYVKSIIIALKAAVTTKPPVKGVTRKGKRKGKKEVFDAEAANAERATSVATEQKPMTWGPLEPLHQILDILFGMVKPLITSQVIIAVLFALLLYNWITGPRGGSGVGSAGFSSPQRLAAYEEMWRRDESELWDWLEDRAGLDHLYAPSLNKDKQDRQKTLSARSMAKKLGDERMNERQIDDAIRVTEERLGALKDAVARKKGGKDPK
ncbi:hypothetical protein LTR36_001892 [Oleoguttula mirabilis]|uniref:VASt domain-containing protein n=1 Tax=Oleoguttula mirabilis TaxID=1507867 RepID=A0AAV9JMT1_9PEZI|nr:hypothetical protein LTR36_001892 [Oleoguttula mirabilis]